MPEWAISLIMPMAGTIAVGLFAKFVPKDKIIAWIHALDQKTVTIGRGIGISASKILILRIGKNASEKVEEGIIVTLASWVGEIFRIPGHFVLAFVNGILADNQDKKRIAELENAMNKGAN